MVNNAHHESKWNIHFVVLRCKVRIDSFSSDTLSSPCKSNLLTCIAPVSNHDKNRNEEPFFLVWMEASFGFLDAALGADVSWWTCVPFNAQITEKARTFSSIAHATESTTTKVLYSARNVPENTKMPLNNPLMVRNNRCIFPTIIVPLSYNIGATDMRLSTSHDTNLGQGPSTASHFGPRFDAHHSRTLGGMRYATGSSQRD